MFKKIIPTPQDKGQEQILPRSAIVARLEAMTAAEEEPIEVFPREPWEPLGPDTTIETDPLFGIDLELPKDPKPR